MTDRHKELTGYPSIDKPWLKYYSEEAINAPLPECTVYEYLWRQNREYPNNVALNYFGNRITFGKLFECISQTAAAFAVLGVKANDIVVLATVTTPETVYAFYGLNRLGAVSNMVDPRTSVEGIRGYIQEVDAKIVLVLDAAYTKIEQAVEGTSVEKIIVISPSDSLCGIKRWGYRMTKPSLKLDKKSILWQAFIDAGRGKTYEVYPYCPNQCCLIEHTGGTTGAPKGVMLSNDNLNAMVFQGIYSGIDVRRAHTWLDIMPPFIAYGMGMGICLPLVVGMETILIPAFDPAKFDRLILKYRPAHMMFVPSYWGGLIESKKLRKADLSFIIFAAVGGDSMNLELEKAANSFLQAHGCHHVVKKGYGMTEICAGVTSSTDECSQLGSVGIPFVKTTISIFDTQTGVEMSYNHPGEVCITGPNTMMGYYRDDPATNAILRLHEDGNMWVHSGDIGYMDEDGRLFILGRIKRMIIRQDGFKVFPSLIEKSICTHPAIKDCCVVGIRDKDFSQGQVPIAFVVLIISEAASAYHVKTELVDICRQELPEYAQPVDFRFLRELPVTSIGKIDYRALEKLADEEM